VNVKNEAAFYSVKYVTLTTVKLATVKSTTTEFL